MATETNWDKINLEKKHDIAWQGAKRGAIDLVSAMIPRLMPMDLEVEKLTKRISEWAELIYALEPKTPKLERPKGKASKAQQDYLRSLYLQKEDKDMGDEYITGMNALTASKEITRLKAMPTINFGDDKNGPSDNREGEKIIDYDSKTGALIP